jgi:hypothetical protein
MARSGVRPLNFFTSGCWHAGEFFGGAGNGVTRAFAVHSCGWHQGGAKFGDMKVAYLSPQFFGFDFGRRATTPACDLCSETTDRGNTLYNEAGVDARIRAVRTGFPRGLRVYAPIRAAGNLAEDNRCGPTG